MSEDSASSAAPVPSHKDDEWRRSPERQRIRFYDVLTWMAFGLTFLFVALMVVLWLPFRDEYFFDASPEAVDRLGPFVLPTLISFMTGFYLLSARQGQRERFEDRQRLSEQEEKLDERQAELIAQGDPQRAELWALTNERLRGYHERAYRQADQSFRNAQVAIYCGFFIVACTAGIAAWKSGLSTPSSVVIGVIGTVGAGLAAYVGRTFLHLQETTAKHMRSYFDQPTETFRYLVAERLIDRLPEDERAESVAYLVQAVMLSGLPIEQVVTALTPPQQGEQGGLASDRTR